MRLILILLSLASPLFAGVERLVLPPGLVALTGPSGTDTSVDVDWEVRKPVDLDRLELDLCDGESALIFNGDVGSQYVVICDAIFWDERRREKTTYIISIEGDPPSPL